MLNKKYAQQIKDKQETPMGAAISFVIDLLNTEINSAQQDGIENSVQKKFVQAVAKINNNLVQTYNSKYGDASGGYIEIDEIKTEKEAA